MPCSQRREGHVSTESSQTFLKIYSSKKYQYYIHSVKIQGMDIHQYMCSEDCLVQIDILIFFEVTQVRILLYWIAISTETCFFAHKLLFAFCKSLIHKNIKSSPLSPQTAITLFLPCDTIFTLEFSYNFNPSKLGISLVHITKFNNSKQRPCVIGVWTKW